MKIQGKAVKDANKELLVTITPQDVKAGAAKNATSCAAAQALVRQGICDEAKVHVNRTYIKKAGKWLRFKTPPALRSEIVAFDRGGSFEPGDYKLMPMSPSQRRGAREARETNRPPEARNPPKTGRSIKKRLRHVTTGVRERFNIGGKIV